MKEDAGRPAEDGARSHPSLGQRLKLDPYDDGLSPQLTERAEAIVNGEWRSLIEAVLEAHLLLEQALLLRIQRRLSRPDVLTDPRFTRLSFSQLITIYSGLYDPQPEDIRRLQAFNRLRNKIAHSLDDPELVINSALEPMGGASRTPADKVAFYFFYLVFGELIGVKAARWIDLHEQIRPDDGE